MSGQVYDVKTKERRDGSRDNEFVTTNYYYSRTGPRDVDRRYDIVTKDHYRRSPSRNRGELVRSSDNRLDKYRDNDRPRDYSQRRRSLPPTYVRRERDYDDRYEKKTEDHHTLKNVAATVLGGIIGGQAGRKASDGSRWAAAAGVVVGAWAGHELEDKWEHHEAKERR